jgi:Response regulator containing CheY-like receiver and SARP domains
METLKVKMLGRFDIFTDHVSILSTLGNAMKSTQIIKHLILNKGKPVSIQKLIDLFWTSSERSSNPESATKTMISRIRANMAKADPSLKNCILADKGAYYWNPDIPCEVDVFVFEDLCGELLATTALTDEVHAKYVEMLEIYEGDLTYHSSDEDWIISRSLYLHHLYIKAVYHFLDFLKEVNDYETIIHTCRLALDIDAFDEVINLELMRALKEDNQNYMALMQYRHVTDMYYRHLGVEPSEQIQNFYKKLIKTDLASKDDLNTIRRNLLHADDRATGAFICDYSIFQDIYFLQLRNIGRQESQIFLSLLTVVKANEETFDPLLLDSIMHSLLEILQECLRKGDAISRYSPSQFAVLLPMINFSNGNIVLSRIKKMFYARYPDSSVKLTFQFGGLNDND